MVSQPVVSLAAVFVLTVSATAQNVEVVQSRGAGVWGSNLRLIEEVRIGQLEGAEAYTFGSIIDVAAGHDGTIWVAEGEPALLRLYDAGGKFIKKVAGVGSGPGEYRQITSLKIMADGSVALRDMRLGLIGVYDARGTFLRSHSLRSGRFSRDNFKVDRQGFFYVQTSAPSREAGFAFSLDPALIWIKIDPTGEGVDTIPVPRGNTPPVQIYGGPHYQRVDPLLSTITPAGSFVTGNPLRYSFDIQRPNQPTLRVERDFQPLRLVGAEKTEWEATASYLSKQPISRGWTSGPDGKMVTVDGPVMKYVAPTAKPAYRELRVDEEGRVWVQRYAPATKQPPPPPFKLPPGALMPPGVVDRPVSLWRDPITHDVFDPTGKFLGTVTQPEKTQFMAMRGRYIWAVTRGEFDEAYVVRYRIE
jgi:hypothetical protein